MSERTYPAMQARTRINHKFSQRTGWYCAETTVEVFGPIHDTVDFEKLVNERLVDAHNDGRIEAARRNKIDGYTEAEAA